MFDLALSIVAHLDTVVSPSCYQVLLLHNTEFINHVLSTSYSEGPGNNSQPED